MKPGDLVYRFRGLNWAAFDRRFRRRNVRLLSRLPEFTDPILVSGCQRSGTTAVSRLISASSSVADFDSGVDSELRGALILVGASDFRIAPGERYCFQTTYLNDRIAEYLEHDNYRLIWLIRNPYSVVYSMLYNWRTSALKRLFNHCRHEAGFAEAMQNLSELNGGTRISKLDMACVSYCAKSDQLSLLSRSLPPERLYAVDYDRLVAEPHQVLPRLFRFIDIPLERGAAEMLHSESRSKAAHNLDASQRARIGALCESVYRRCLALATDA